MTTGTVVAIYLCSERSKPLASVSEVQAIPGRGLQGDRYFFGQGSFSRWPGEGRAASFIAGEVIDDVRATTGLELGNGCSRRNIETRGVDLRTLIGCTFRIGTVLFRGVRECPPCGYLERLLGQGLMHALHGRGGLRADVLEEGVMRTGDAIEVIAQSLDRSLTLK
jgi:MOSC domain-containing protein YiiM